MSKMLKMFEAARRVSVPIVSIETADQFATVEALRDASRGEKQNLPVVQWDGVRGLTHVNDEGAAALAAAFPSKDKRQPYDTSETVGFSEAMLGARMLQRGTVVCVHNAQRHLTSTEPSATASAIQAICNIRDDFKKSFRMLVLLSPGFPVPLELKHDVVVMTHELPTPDELATVVEELFASAKLEPPTRGSKEMTKITDALAGVSLFAAEQDLAMSLTPTGLDYDALWNRTRDTIDRTRGAKVWRGAERFDDIVGATSVKTKLERKRDGRTPVGVVVFIDEIDKVFPSNLDGTNDVKTDQFKTFLTEMENNEWTGMILVGVPGAGKSLVGKAFGNECGVPTLAVDTGDLESKYVGESEAYVRNLFAVIKAVGRGNAYFIATSNNATIMRPEMQRRFTDGMFFFDVMTKEERDAAWTYYLAKYELDDQPRPNDDGWTGAEIRNCCRSAWNDRISLVEAAQFIIPMSRGRAPEIEELRKTANGKFLDANKPGAYAYNPAPMKEQLRAIAIPAGALQDIVNMQES